MLDTKYTGLIAEHVGAYYCLEEMKWGSGWHEHDAGLTGRWEKQPSETVLGRLDGGGKLEKLLADSRISSTMSWLPAACASKKSSLTESPHHASLSLLDTASLAAANLPNYHDAT
ncbi:hypothetical protein [Burkholderia sp. LMG 32019]|uniref:hypothetical protein n=1 Tax=Burkholderia sp. LMG 32019 TaxID=3158173 RepID=UPI003C2FB21C